MGTEVLDIYLDDVNREYLNKLTFLTLFKSRSLGYRCAADMVCEAFRDYSENILEETLIVLETCQVCKFIVSYFEISYKEDLLYLVRHPSKMEIKMDPPQKQVRKKILNFFDLDAADCAYKKEAYEYFSSLRPIKRAPQIDKMLKQYLIITKNEYFIHQAAARLVNNLLRIAEFDKNGNVQGEAKELVNAIWAMGRSDKE